ncbi:MAG TPA: aldo/keto reductase [Candidatus Hydrogenedentes bacterium]|nr:aldo/keto reductase [Candidatus Hydrogenedentota bacterium]
MRLRKTPGHGRDVRQSRLIGINRRDFIQVAAGTVAASLAVPAAHAEEIAKPAAPAIRTLGKCGVTVTLPGMGTGTKAWNHTSELIRRGRDAYLGLLRHAYDKGIRFFDMADMYGTHPYMHEALKSFIPRDKAVLLTKTVARDPKLVRDDLERFRKELDTDMLDIVLLHCVTDPDWTEKLKPCMDVLAEAKAKGIIRAHGLSSHNLDVSQKAAEHPWVDILMERINPFGKKMDAPPDRVVPVLRTAHENGKGVIGMKIACEGECKDNIAESIRFVLGLGCVDALSIGFLEPAEVDSAMTHIGAALATANAWPNQN